MKRRLEQGPIVSGLDFAAVSEPAIFRSDCPCCKSRCSLHGRCAECRAKHGRKGQLPRCER
jgi:hypothetical protein